MASRLAHRERRNALRNNGGGCVEGKLLLKATMTSEGKRGPRREFEAARPMLAKRKSHPTEKLPELNEKM